VYACAQIPTICAGSGRGEYNNFLNIEDLSTGHKITFTNETTSAAPALAVDPFSGRLVVAWTGTDAQHHLNVGSSFDGVNWGNKSTLPQTTPAADGPALARYNFAFNDPGRGLAIGWTGTDNQLNVAYSHNDPTDRAFGPAHPLGITSPYGPALAEGASGDLDLAFTKPSTQVEVLDLAIQVGINFSNATTKSAPSLVGAGTSLVVAWTGTDGRLNVGNVGTQHAQTINETSPYGPSLAVDPAGALDIAWTGTDAQRHLNETAVSFP
jgi:hypothetical protein